MISLLGRLPVWCILNAYAFLLDALCIAAGASVLWLRSGGQTPWLWVPAAGVAFLLGVGACRLHMAYGDKLHLYRALLRRNSRMLRLASFEDFVDVPCHRLTVRLVLARVGHPECYREVLRLYYRWPWRRWPKEEEGVWFFR